MADFFLIHCKKCVEEIQSGEAGTTSPQEYARLEVAVLPDHGLINISCVRHVEMVGTFQLADVPEWMTTRKCHVCDSRKAH